VFQFQKTIHFLETSRTNHIAPQLVVATGMTPFYQILSYHAGYTETGTCYLFFMSVYSNGKLLAIAD
jgi:hypothetical protein